MPTEMNASRDVLVGSPPLRLEAIPEHDTRTVARELRWGRANARQIGELARVTGIPGRRVQEIVQELLHEHRWPIGTAMTPPHGNYLIDTRDELDQTVGLLRMRGLSNLKRAAALRRMSVRAFLMTVQLEMELASTDGDE